MFSSFALLSSSNSNNSNRILDSRNNSNANIILIQILIRKLISILIAKATETNNGGTNKIIVKKA
jgi:hypothetical protein